MTTVIIPTYNEKENINLLLPALRQVFEDAAISGRVCVVDDGSPDGTAHEVKKFQELHPEFTHIIEREGKNGIGSAYIHAFQHFLEDSDFIVQMDADLSHHPESVLDLIAAAKEHGAVVGSRYIPEGRISNWGFLRRAISRYGNYYACSVLSLPVKDATTGFRCFNTKHLAQIPLTEVSSDGYVFQIEMLWWFHKKELPITEVPIHFTERRNGVSKFSKAIFWEAFWKVLELRYKN